MAGDYRKFAPQKFNSWYPGDSSTLKKLAFGGLFWCLRRKFSEIRTGWLGREESNLRMGESKSPALPLGYAPVALNGQTTG